MNDTSVEPQLLFPGNFRARAHWVLRTGVAFAVCLFGILPPARGQDPKLTELSYPRDASVSVGETVSFLVYASSTNPPMTYQWQHEGTNLPGATRWSLTLSDVTVAQAGGYRGGHC